MGFYVNISDFTGKFEVHQGMYSNNDLNDYIQRYELDYLKQLFGVPLYNEYYANAITNPPTNIPPLAKFSYLYNPFDYQNTDDFWLLCQSKGIKDMLIGFIWFEFNKDQVSTATPLGQQKQKNELSEAVISTLYNRYNESVKTYRAIQTYIAQNSGTYQNFRGQIKGYAYWL